MANIGNMYGPDFTFLGVPRCDLDDPKTYADAEVVIVGARNSKINTKTLDQVQAYWTCYLNQIGITNVTEQSDLSGF